MAYNVYKNGVKVDTTEEKQYLFEGLEPDTSYTLGVSKVEGGKESEIATTEVKTKPLEKPVAHENVRATDVDETSFVLNWDHAPKGNYQVHIDGFLKHDNVTDNKVLLEGLEPNTEYRASVLTVLNGMQSMPVAVTVTTKEMHIPYSLKVIDKTDTSITVAWDSDEELGEGIYNIYLNNQLHKQDIKQRTFTLKGLQPSTEYKICLCGVKADGSETPKVTINETTLQEITEIEPEVGPLVNILKDGSFENYTGGLPNGWVDKSVNHSFIQVDDEFHTDGTQSMRFGVEQQETQFAGVAAVLQKVIDLPDGYYITVLDYKMPTSQKVDGTDKEKYVFTMLAANSENYEEVYGGSGTMYVVGKMEGSVNSFINLYLADYKPTIDPAYASIDSIRMYQISPEMYDYLNKGKMDIERIKEVFPYTENNAMDVAQYHTGAGWYDLPNGERVRGKEAAEEELKKIDE